MESNKVLLDNTKIVIGYQGIEGSNSEEVAHMYVKQFLKLEKTKIEYIPLINSKNVVNALNTNKIDLGIMAISNTKAGVVIETEEALKGTNFEILENIKVPIHHCVFKKKNVDIKQIKSIASHIQALEQTRNHLTKLFPNYEQIEVEDTALAAKYLSDNIFEDSVAVVCRKSAGEMFKLELIYENIEDDKENFTLFGVYKK